MSDTRPVRRIAFLFTRLSGYIAACLKTLRKRHGVELLVVRRPTDEEAPYEARYFDWIDELHDRNTLQQGELDALLARFDPQGVYLAGWTDRAYLRAALRLRQRGTATVVGSDAQWSGSLRQQIARLIAPWYLHAVVDAIWVPGERQRQMASRLGFSGDRCWNGGDYSCDWDRFAAAYDPTNPARPDVFLFVGRYALVKGLDLLVEAYRRYRTAVSHPWPLLCAGAGSEQALLHGVEGIEELGFVQPDKLPALMKQAGALVLASRREPWGVVVHEAATAGLPILCADVAGAAVHLVQDGFNGVVFEAGNARHLAQGMERMTRLSVEERAAMGRRSHLLSTQFTPQRWADTLVRGVASIRSNAR